MKIRFNQPYKVRAVDGAEYKEGEIVEVSPRSADHFMSRGVADLYEEPAPKPQPKPEQPRGRRAKDEAEV